MTYISSRKNEVGAFSGAIVAIVLLVVALIGVSGLAVWAYLNYNEQKTNVDGKISKAVALAEKTQKTADENEFLEREKEPNREFIGPADYGSLSFSYPKTWSLYVAQNGTNSSGYEAYLHPISVPAVASQTERFALRVTIQNMQYEQVMQTYQALVQTGDLKSSAIKVNGQSAARLDGKITPDVRGSLVVFKIRDKTVTLRTDANTFKKDFDKLIKTVRFNQ